MKIESNKYVILEYELYVGEEGERELMERATKEVPLEFIYGTNSMLQSFEDKLKGKAVGDKFEFSLSPEEAYGEFEDEKIIELPKNLFEVNGKVDEELLQEGKTVPMVDTQGNRLLGSVVKVEEDVVSMDFNHPLAGENLHFSGTVLEVRNATPEEIASLYSNSGCCCSGCSDTGCGSKGHGCC